MKRLALMVVVLLSACGTPSGGMGGGAGGGAAGAAGGAGGGTGGAGGGAAALTDLQRVEIYCDKTLLPACTGWFTSKAQCVDLMKRTASALCESKWVAETDCLAQTAASDWACSAGEPGIASTQCRDQYGFGSYCRLAIADVDCFVGACTYDSDCPSGMSCNDKTQHCFKTTARCAGLPCKYNADCTTGFTCNNALEQCVKS